MSSDNSVVKVVSKNDIISSNPLHDLIELIINCKCKTKYEFDKCIINYHRAKKNNTLEDKLNKRAR